jgi:serine phosphatase RsbU (regulator of sigma subunit)
MTPVLQEKLSNKILIVDDTPHNLRLLSTMLIEQGYNVRAVINGTMAINSAQLDVPDVILLDISMPGMDGYEVCKRLKSDQQTCHIPIIFISALDETMDKVKAFQVGGVDYITKPFQVEEVLARIKNQLTIHTLQQQLEQQVQQLQILNARMHNEMALARNIQQGFLPPSHPEWNSVDIVCYSVPAHEIGGDLYIYHSFEHAGIPAHENHYAVAIGDVSGKGMPAALLMSVSVVSFRSLVRKGLRPGAFLAEMDTAIADYTRTTGQNCAFVYLDIVVHRHQPDSPNPVQPASTPADTPTAEPYATMTVANAGCVSPLLKRHNGEVCWLDICGMPLGVGIGAQTGYHEHVSTLHKDDIIILTSDGVLEAKTADGTLFGFDRLEQAVASGPQSAASDMLAHLQAEIELFTGSTEVCDDITIVVVRV